jgi:hypothetical protein
MQCPTCQAEVSQEKHFCDHCGAKLSVATVKPAAPAATSELFCGDDGVWRWTYELSLWRNPTVLITLIKVILLASLIPVLVTGAITLFESGPLESLRVIGIVLGYVLGIMLVLMILAYLAVALVFGGKYCVVFEMDAQGVKHIQMEKQFGKNQLLAMLTVITGAATGISQAAGAGLLAGSKRSSYSKFSRVKSIVLHPHRNVIYVNEILSRNQVYAPAEFYETIQQHILDRCPKAKVVRH